MTNAANQTLFLSGADVKSVLTWDAVVGALRDAYGLNFDDAMAPGRSTARGDRSWLRAMPAAHPDGKYIGAKLISVALAERSASYLIALFEQRSAELVGLIDGNDITAWRTAGTSAVAVQALTQDQPLKVAFIGSGFEARAQLQALATVRSISELKVFSPTVANRERFADSAAREHKLRATSVASSREAVEGADLVIAAARSHDETPTIEAGWLAPGATVVSIGSTLPEQRELDIETLDRAGVIVADAVHEVAEETGDMLAAAEAGLKLDSKLKSLADIVGSESGFVRDPDSIAVYKSVGSGLQDIVLAELCLTAAVSKGLGTTLVQSIVPISK